MLDYVGLCQYLDAECSSVRPVNYRNFWINSMKLGWLTGRGAFNLREWSEGPSWKLESKTVTNMPQACAPGELVNSERLDKLFQELLSELLPVVGLVYCFYSAPYDCLHLFRYSKLWWASIKVEYKNWTDNGGPFFLPWHIREFYAVSGKQRLGLYVCVSEWMGYCKPCPELEVRRSPMFAYMRREFVDGREQSVQQLGGPSSVWLARIIVLRYWCRS